MTALYVAGVLFVLAVIWPFGPPPPGVTNCS